MQLVAKSRIGLPRSGIRNQVTATVSDEDDVEDADDAVRQQFAEDQLPAGDGGDVQLLERAQLLLTHDGHRRQVRRDHEQQQRDDPRNHEVAAFELGIEPDANSRVDRPRRRILAGGDLLLPRELLVVAVDQVAGIPHRDIRGVGVGSIGNHLHRRGTAAADALVRSRRG